VIVGSSSRYPEFRCGVSDLQYERLEAVEAIPGEFYVSAVVKLTVQRSYMSYKGGMATRKTYPAVQEDSGPVSIELGVRFPSAEEIEAQAAVALSRVSQPFDRTAADAWVQVPTGSFKNGAVPGIELRPPGRSAMCPAVSPRLAILEVNAECLDGFCVRSLVRQYRPAGRPGRRSVSGPRGWNGENSEAQLALRKIQHLS
jgi:hypothetical protein